MNAVTSGPTPTPAAATVAACSTSREIPRRCVSLPASRMTQRCSVPAASTRKFRLVIPPDRAVRVSSRPASSGTFCMARDELVVQLPVEDLRSSLTSRVGAFTTRSSASPVARSASTWTLSSFPRCADEVVERADDHDRADLVSKIGQAGSSSWTVPPTLMNVLMNGFDHVLRRSLP